MIPKYWNSFGMAIMKIIIYTTSKSLKLLAKDIMNSLPNNVMRFPQRASMGEFVAHKLVKVLVCGFETGFQTSSGFNTV